MAAALTSATQGSLSVFPARLITFIFLLQVSDLHFFHNVKVLNK